MKKVIFILAASIFISLGYSQSKSNTNNNCVSQTDAEKILGQPAQLTESSSEIKDGINQQKCTYTGKENKISNLYCMLEEYDNSELAHNAYAYILLQNRNNPGLKKIDNFGDEAYIHSDDVNFLFIICRKGNKMIRLKVNKLTRITSLQEMKNAAKKFSSAK